MWTSLSLHTDGLPCQMLSMNRNTTSPIIYHSKQKKKQIRNRKVGVKSLPLWVVALAHFQQNTWVFLKVQSSKQYMSGMKLLRKNEKRLATWKMQYLFLTVFPPTSCHCFQCHPRCRNNWTNQKAFLRTYGRGTMKAKRSI